MNRARILVVDDQPNLRWMVKTNLTRHGFEVLEAADGEEALRLIANESPDLLVLDVMMPKLDGFEVLEKLQQVPGTRDIPVIFLTAKASERDRIHGLALGAHDYVSKPFSLQELYLRITRLLETRAQIERLVEFGKRDAVTGLSNRQAFEMKLRELWADRGGEVSLIFLTLQHLDEVTTRDGLDRLDEVLAVVADSLKQVAPEEGHAFWVGGNHAAVLVPWAEERAERLRDALSTAIGEAIAAAGMAGTIAVSSSLAERTADEGLDEFLRRATAQDGVVAGDLERDAQVIPIGPWVNRRDKNPRPPGTNGTNGTNGDLGNSD